MSTRGLTIGPDDDLHCHDCGDTGWQEDRDGRSLCSCIAETYAGQELTALLTAVDRLDLGPFENARFGVFRPDGQFAELDSDGGPLNMSDPDWSTARWVGGDLDAQLLRAFLLSLPAPGDVPERGWREVLGVSDPAQADAAYRRLASDAHPDRGGSHERMAVLNKARELARAEMRA